MRKEITQTPAPIRCRSSAVPQPPLSPQPEPFSNPSTPARPPPLPHHTPSGIITRPSPSLPPIFPIASPLPSPLPTTLPHRPPPSAHAIDATHRRRVWSAGGRGAAAPRESCRASGRNLCFPFSCGRGRPSHRRRTRCGGGGGDPRGPPGHTRPCLGAPSSARPSTPPEAPWCVWGGPARASGRGGTGRREVGSEGRKSPRKKKTKKENQILRSFRGSL